MHSRNKPSNACIQLYQNGTELQSIFRNFLKTRLLAFVFYYRVNGYELNTQTYGLVSGMLNSGYSLGSFAGPLLSGYLTEKYEFAWATTIMTLTLLAMVISIVYYTFP